MKTIFSLLLLSASLGATALAAEVPLLPAGDTDQVATRVVSRPAPVTPVEHSPVRFSWALDPTDDLRQPEPFVVESREYWQTVDAAELQRGVEVSTSAPGAIIRVSPAHAGAAVDVDALRVTRGGRTVALARRNDGAQLRAAGMQVNERAAAVQLADAAPAGRYRLQMPKASGQYVVHVYEPRSTVRLFAALARDRVLAGGASTIVVNLSDGDRRLQGLKAGGLLVAPSGESWPIRLRPGRDGLLRGKVPVPTEVDHEQGLWEVQVFAGNGDVQRDARTALAVAQPTARLVGDYSFDAAQLQFALPMTVGSPGRYEVRGTLYATAPGGALQPVSIAHSADWLTPGRDRLLLGFDRGNLPAGYGAPFELRDLELNDQSRMAPIERRARAARVSR
ncbi:DUF4785 domain-containing protein [Lysobacter sp. F6437]|uniref:DUF4785 domain-containing protein n=1 Tax=Lysobacter sp. F6437 TaxID=3459296 RepID=UPI00403DECEC